MLAYGKNMPRNNQFSVFLPRKGKILPQNKNLPNFVKNLPQNTTFTQSPSPPTNSKINKSKAVVTRYDVAYQLKKVDIALTLPDVRGCERHHWCLNSFNFMQFLQQFGKIVCWHPPSPMEGWHLHIREILDPAQLKATNLDRRFILSHNSIQMLSSVTSMLLSL